MNLCGSWILGVPRKTYFLNKKANRNIVVFHLEVHWANISIIYLE